MSQHKDVKIRKSAVQAIDGLVVLCFAIYSLLFFLGKWDGSQPFIDLSGDMALNVAGSAAVMDHPDLLVKDAVLGNPDNIRFYQSIHIPLTRILARGDGDYGRAVIAPLGLHVFLQLCGFYLLGRVILKNRFWAVLFAAMTAITVTLSLGEYWGVYSDPQPRFTFQVLLPFLLAAAYHWKENVKAWPLLMVAAGFLVYVHSVSAPLWAFALWLGFWIYLPRSWSFLTRVLFMLMTGLDFIIISFPFIINYLGGRVSATPLDIENVKRVMLSVYPNYFRPWLDLQEIIAILAKDALLWPGLAGLCILVWLMRKNFRTLGLVLLWLTGIMFVSIVIPTLELYLFHGASHIAFTPIWVRGIRYLVPFLMLFCLWPLAEISHKLACPQKFDWHVSWLDEFKDGLASRPIQISLNILGVFVVLAANILSDAGYQSGRSLQWRMPEKALACWTAGELICPSTPVKASQLDILKKIKSLPPGSTILPIINENDKQYSLELAIRYTALQPVVFTDKDFSTYWQSNPSALIQWEEDAKEIDRIKTTEGMEQRARAAQEIGERLGASFLLLDWEAPGDNLAGRYLIYKNDRYFLYEINRPDD